MLCVSRLEREVDEGKRFFAIKLSTWSWVSFLLTHYRPLNLLALPRGLAREFVREATRRSTKSP